MPKWRIIIPVIIVAIVGVIAYMMVAPAMPDQQPELAAEESSDIPLDVIGTEDIGTQADAVVNELLKGLDDEDLEAGDGTAEIDSVTAGESEFDILDVEYYEE